MEDIGNNSIDYSYCHNDWVGVAGSRTQAQSFENKR